MSRVASCSLSRRTRSTGISRAGTSTPASRPLQACVREVREELGITPGIGRLLAVDWAPAPLKATRCCTSSTVVLYPRSFRSGSGCSVRRSRRTPSTASTTSTP
ncbi:NUDIX domain-containing protein [Streptomyces sp. MNP-20]|uniref:NUDIX domain-containing protein n=1 Tax=Streptomyces sp. MNP-20 TaxID=2721165 RepID=UPI002816795E|nr:NUDIX domain-containing protein [Streptomyces sp. MNP-20]